MPGVARMPEQLSRVTPDGAVRAGRAGYGGAELAWAYGRGVADRVQGGYQRGDLLGPRIPA